MVVRRRSARDRCCALTAACGICGHPSPCPSPTRGEGTRGTDLRKDSDVVALSLLRACERLTPHSVTSIFTAAVIFCQVAISPASQALASSTDFDGTILKFCLISASLAVGVCSASTVALYKVSSTGLGVPAGANIAFHATVPTSAKPTSTVVGTSG